MNKEKVFAWIESLEDMADQSDRYFVERTELYKENQEKDKEIEKLNNEIKTLLKENGNKEKVIIKQNNIIDNTIKYINKYQKDKNIFKLHNLRLNSNKLLNILKGDNNE